MLATVRRVVLPVLGVALAVAVWWALSLQDDRTPSPAAVFRTIVDGMRTSDGLLLDARLSVLRVLIGVALGATAAVPSGSRWRGSAPCARCSTRWSASSARSRPWR